eukprot:868109_1
MLRFNNKERKTCRIGTNTHNNTTGIWGYATSWLGNSKQDNNKNNNNNVSSPSGSNDKPNDLGSLWVEFLLNELGDDDIDGNQGVNIQNKNTQNDINDNVNNNNKELDGKQNEKIE